VTNDLDTLATALYVKIDDLLKRHPIRRRGGRRSAFSRRRAGHQTVVPHRPATWTAAATCSQTHVA
jgi:hypothetical protein